MAKTPQTKKCTKCTEVKSIDEFHNHSKTKDKKQIYCKTCMLKASKNQKLDNPTQWKEYNTEYHKSNKNALIYRIVNPLGETYTGSTMKRLNVRFASHRATYKHSNGLYPLLHKSFDTWGIDAHIFELVVDLGNISRNELRYIESRMIKNFMNNDKSLNGKL